MLLSNRLSVPSVSVKRFFEVNSVLHADPVLRSTLDTPCGELRIDGGHNWIMPALGFYMPHAGRASASSTC